MWNLEKRAECDLNVAPGEDNQQPYTYVQNVLVAINPLRRVPHPPRDLFYNKKLTESPPHPYGIAENSFQRLSSTSVDASNMNQSIVISGESGAGKTESTKICLNYLTKRSSSSGENNWIEATDEASGKTYYHNQATGETVWELPAKKDGLDKRILDSNPILESFGNAKTTRNSNSSRFGKFMILQFTNDKKYSLYGATMETYLLEKSRITFQMQNERNYHVFYLLLAGASAEQKQALQLSGPEHYKYTNQSGCIKIDRFDDVQEWGDFCSALQAIGLSIEQMHAMFCTLSAILNLGNCEFYDESTSAGEEARFAEPRWMEICAAMLGVEIPTLDKCLREEMRIVKGETFFSKRDAKAANFTRDAVTKTLYQLLFDWTVNSVAASLNKGPDDLPFVGILDIFGFETFKKNDFEQLLINFANETLQATFNKAVLQSEMELYKQEQIKVEPIKFSDNVACVQLVVGRPQGVLCQLEAVAKAPNPSDLKFCQAIHKLHADHPFFPRPHPKDIRENFIIRHFADDVKYTVGTFIQKNNEEVPKDLLELIMNCAHVCLKESIQATAGRKVKTVTGLFAKQMQGLRDKLESTQCNFIRCIKPNPRMQAGDFDRPYTIGQLRFLGVLNTCKVLKLGLPSRVGYEHVGEPLRESLPIELKSKFARYGSKKVTGAVLWSAEIPWDDYRLGLTKCFFRAGKIGQLDKVMKMNINGPEGQAFCKRLKKWLVRQQWKWSIKLICDQLTSVWLLELIRKKPPMALRLQSFWRMYAAKKNYVKLARRVRLWQLTYSIMCANQLWVEHYKYCHDNKEAMIKKQKEMKKKRLRMRLLGDTGEAKVKRKKGAEGEDSGPKEPSSIDKRLQARIRAKLAETKGKRNNARSRNKEVVNDANATAAAIEAITYLNDVIKSG